VDEVVEVRHGRLGQAVAERRRGYLLEVDDVCVAGRRSDAPCELAPRQALERTCHAEQAGPKPWRLGLDVYDFDAKLGWRISRDGPFLARGNDVHVDAVLSQATDQRQCATARGASFRERRLGQDEQRLHAASARR
jgi:hypothetical protein